MPLHQSGLVSRTGLQHPEPPKAREPLNPPPFELVLKAGTGYNPFRAKSGLFTSAGGGEPSGKGGKALASGATDTGEKSGIAVGNGGSGGGETASVVQKPAAPPVDPMDHVSGDTAKILYGKMKGKSGKIIGPTANDEGYFDVDLGEGQIKSMYRSEIQNPRQGAALAARQKEVRAVGKTLKLPGGKDAQVADAGDSYNWTQRGGYANNKLSDVANAAEAAGFVKQDTKHTGNPDGSVMGSGTTYVKEGWSLTLDSSIGQTKYDNYWTIRLKKTK